MHGMRRLGWLAAASRIGIGPSGRAVADMTVVLQPSPGDYASVVEDQNLGVSVTLHDQDLTHNFLTGSAGQDVVLENALLNFDLSSISATSWRVATAELTLYQERNSASGAVFDLFRNTMDWSSTTVTWASRPSFAASPVASVTLAGAPGAFYSFDVTSAVGAWLDGTQPDFGFTLKRMDETNSFVFFASGANGTAAFRPELTLVLTPVPEPPALGLLAAGLLALPICLRRPSPRCGPSAPAN